MIQYVSNAGIILVEEGIGIGIDCFCRDSQQLYPDTPPQIREQLWGAIEEGDISVLIFTHEHEDHFCAEDVKAAWERNSKLQIYSTKNVIDLLRKQGIAESSLTEIHINEAQDAPVWKELGSVKVGFLGSVHEGAQYADIPNLTLLLEMGERRVCLTGDAAPSAELFEKIGTWSRNIDGFFLPFPYVGLRSTRKLLSEHFCIDKMFVMHQPRKQADEQNWIKNTKRVCEQATDGLPAPLFPERLGGWYYI